VGATSPKPLQHGTGEYQPPGYPTTTAFGVPTRFVPGPLNSGLNQAQPGVGRAAGADRLGRTDGIVVTYASSASFTRDATTGAALKVNGISVIRGPATTSKDGIRIIGDSANASGTIQPDTVFDDVVVRGGANGGGWTNCIVAQDVADTSWFHVLCQGPFTASAINSPTRGAGTAGVVIKTTGSRYATQHNFSHCTFNVLGRGLDIYERIQGIALTNCNFTGGQYGIYWNSVGRQDQLAVSNSQFSTLVAGIYVYDMQNVIVQGCLFLNQNYYVPAASANNWYGLELDEIDNCAITGSNFMGSYQPTALEFGIAITNDTALVAVDAPSVIAGNTFYNLHGEALYTRNTTTNVLFTGNAVDHIAGFPVIVADPGTTPICIGNTFSNAPFLSGFPGTVGAAAARDRRDPRDPPDPPDPLAPRVRPGRPGRPRRCQAPRVRPGPRVRPPARLEQPGRLALPAAAAARSPGSRPETA
jgi:hypothetical protein